MKKIYSLAFLFLPLYAYSCENKNISPIVEIDIKPLAIDYAKNAQFLNASYPNSPHQSHFPLGLYQAPKQIEIIPRYSILKNSATGVSCAQITQINFKLILSPVIYISKEAGQFNCTAKRVYQHEMTHYHIETNALEQMKPLITESLKNIYSLSISSRNEKEMQYQISQKNNQMMKGVSDIFEKYTDPYHSQLDNADNYRKESEACSREENIAIWRLLRNTSRIDVLR